MPYASLTTELPRAVPRGPTGRRSSRAPPVPLRSSDPANAGAVAQASKASTTSTRTTRPFIIRSSRFSACVVIIAGLLEVVETLSLHEHHQPSERGAHGAGIDVVDVHAAAHREPVFGQEIPGEHGAGDVGLLESAYQVTGQVEDPDRAGFREIHEPDDPADLIALVARVVVVRIRNHPHAAQLAGR